MTPIVIFSLFIAGFTALILLAVAQNRTRQMRERFIDDYPFPPGVLQRVHKRYPHLTEPQLELVFRALREYFHLCRKANSKLLAMPSQVVDVA